MENQHQHHHNQQQQREQQRQHQLLVVFLAVSPLDVQQQLHKVRRKGCVGCFRVTRVSVKSLRGKHRASSCAPLRWLRTTLLETDQRDSNALVARSSSCKKVLHSPYVDGYEQRVGWQALNQLIRVLGSYQSMLRVSICWIDLCSVCGPKALRAGRLESRQCPMGQHHNQLCSQLLYGCNQPCYESATCLYCSFSWTKGQCFTLP